MAKKQPPTRTVPTGEAAKLTHSPFAALNARLGNTPPQAGQADEPVESPSPVAVAPGKPARPGARGRLVLRRETKHRGGKTVIVVAGFEALPELDADALDALARDLKQQLGCGGTVEQHQIVLQGDRAADVAQTLRARGFRVDGVTS
jgi:translation initiation factor 1